MTDALINLFAAQDPYTLQPNSELFASSLLPDDTQTFSLGANASFAIPPELLAPITNDFISEFNTFGSAVVSGSSIQLTKAAPYTVGSAYTKESFSLVDGLGVHVSFSLEYEFSMPGAGGIGDSDGLGADGLVFVIGKSSSIGQVGIGMGYGGIGNSIAIEYDTYNNGVDNGGRSDNNNSNHIGIDVNGNLNSVVFKPISTRLNDGSSWRSWVDYKANTKTLEVRLSQLSAKPASPDLSYSVDLASAIGSNQAYFGFTAGTGSGYEQHLITDFNFERDDIRLIPKHELMRPLSSFAPLIPTTFLSSSNPIGISQAVGATSIPQLDVTVLTKRVSFYVYDWGTSVDDDIVKIKINGKDISGAFALPAPKNARKFTFEPQPGQNRIEIEAVNVGALGPSTAGLFLNTAQVFEGKVFWSTYVPAGAVEGFTLGSPQITLSQSRNPEAAQHILDAQTAGFPKVVQLERGDTAKTDSRRTRSQNAYKKNGGKLATSTQDLDEYPPASTVFRYNSGLSSVRPISSSDNRSAGSYTRQQWSSYGKRGNKIEDGSLIEFHVIP